MTNKDKENGSTEGHWISRWFPFCTLGNSGCGTMMRSLREDYPLWAVSMWILWKQQTQNNRKSISDGISSPFVRSKAPGGDHHAGSSAAVVNLLVDWIVMGTLLIYKKSRDEKHSRSDSDNNNNNDSDNNNNNDNDNDDGGNREVATTNKSTETGRDREKDALKKEDETDPIQELRMLLKQNGIGSSSSSSSSTGRQQLVNPKPRTRSPRFSSIPLEKQPLSLPLPIHQPQTPMTMTTITSGATSYEKNDDQQQRYIELLVHNVAHTDLVMSLDAPPPPPPSSSSSSSTEKDGNDSYCLCRPKFSAFDAYSQRLYDFLKVHGQKELREAVIQLPQYERDDETQQPQPASEKLSEGIPVGFRLGEEKEDNSRNRNGESAQHEHPLRVSFSKLEELRVRSVDAPRVAAHSSTSGKSTGKSTGTGTGVLNIDAVFFPLLAALMPAWEKKIDEKYGSFSRTTTTTTTTTSSPKPKKVLILVSGVGQPRDWTHNTKSNSTQQCAKLMEIFLKTTYPDLVVLHIHSDTDIFRYDENIAFVKHELLPRVQEYRDAHAKGLPYPDEIARLPPEIRNSIVDTDRPFSTEWRKSFSITISYADGSSARNSAIQASLRTFKPTYCHFSQLKTFWHELKIVSSDVEIHSFEEMETVPPQGSDQFKDRPLVKQVVDEIKKFRDEFIQILHDSSEDSNDIRAFWLRKTHKPVIAILAVQRPNGKVKLYRGMNLEVSMPTGSLCAERNVIGTALADNPALRRQDLKMIAVLAVPNPKQSRSINSIPSSRKSSIGQEDDWVIQDHHSSLAGAPVAPLLEQHKTLLSSKSYPDLLLQSSLEATYSSDSPPGLARKTYLYNTPPSPSRRHSKRVVVVHSGHDINPLLPCGACNEWLKKLSESNPHFTILSFTDAACTGVYCTPCEE